MKKLVVFAISLLCAAQLFAQGQSMEARTIIANIMPYIKAEIKGTQAEADINAFYASPAFKKSGLEAYKVYVGNDKSVADASAYWHRFERKVFINTKFIEDSLKLDLRVPLQGFAKDPAKMARLAVIIAPIYVHEIVHQRETVELEALGIKNVPTLQSEYLAHFAQYAFMSEKQLSKGKDYYAWTPSFHTVLLLAGDRLGVDGIAQIVTKVYQKNQQIFQPFDKEHIVMLAGQLMNVFGNDPAQLEKNREASFKKDLLALGIIKPGEKVLITVNDYLSTGKYNWNRITLVELDNAYNGRNALFNKYSGWFDSQTKRFMSMVNEARKKKQLKSYLSLNSGANPKGLEQAAAFI